MTTATLMSHVDTDAVTREGLATLPMPEATGTFKPVPHIELVESLDSTLRESGISIREEGFAVRRDGSALFGVMKLNYGTLERVGEAAIGLRTANDKTMSIQICAGLSVFVCDNMCFRGDMIALKRKHTSGLNLMDELRTAVATFTQHFDVLRLEVSTLQQRMLADADAKVIIHDVFADGLMPIRFMPKVSNEYFTKDQRHEDFAPRTAWSLHNAFTEIAKEMPLTTRMPAIQAVGRRFGLVATSNN